MPSSDDLLEQAAERCGFVLPTALAELVYNEMQGARRGVDNERTLHESIAREVLAMSTPSTAVDREALVALFRAAPDRERLGDQTPGEIADALLARYDIRERGETRLIEQKDRAHIELITLKDTFTGCTDTDPNNCACNDPGLPSCDACSEEIESGRQAYMQSAPGYPWLADDHTDQEYVITWWHVECDQRAERGDLS